MTILIKAAVVGIAGAVIGLLLKRSAPELGLALSIAASLLAASLAAELIGTLTDLIDLAEEQTGLSPAVVAPVMKCVGISVVTRIASDMCKDAGQGAISSAVELCGTACALAAALPLIQTLLQMISGIL